MTQWCLTDPALKTFSGRAPLFPLPNLVLFPHAAVPLHIFEPRYREMTADALAGESLLAIGLQSSAGSDSIAPMVGLGRIIAHERLDDGRYILVLRGVARARIIQEEPLDRAYRVGHLELCCDQVPETETFDRQIRADEITSLFCNLFPGVEFQRLIQQAMSEDLPLGSVCDIIASALPVAPSIVQNFLEELNTDTRSQMLWQLLKRMEPRQEKAVGLDFPPTFSLN
ncbi:MAG TPA: LON peptidase substrate-binding domain-containing protein [Schlesneria sp.]|jgi:Lon protease-like protein